MRAIALLLLVFTMSLAALAQQRFDFKVREDMFAGMDGDTVAFDRAMKLIADTLAREPDHAEALVWRGDGRLFMAGQAFQRGDFAGGQKLFTEGLADMERAVALAPNDIAVRVPRASGLLAYARALRRVDRSEADRLTRIAVGDFEFVLQASQSRWDKLSEHGRGEVLGALADGWLMLGESAKADVFLDRMTAELPGTPTPRMPPSAAPIRQRTHRSPVSVAIERQRCRNTRPSQSPRLPDTPASDRPFSPATSR